MQRRGFWPSGLIWGGSLALDAAALGILVRPPNPGPGRIGVFLVLHVSAAALVMEAASRARGEPFPRAALDGFVALAMPLLGVLSAGLILLFGTVLRRYLRVPEEELREHLGSPGGARRDVEVRVLEPQVRATPLGELLRCQDLEKVEEALVELRGGSPEAEIDLLKTLMSHSLPEVRLRAHLLMLEMQDRAISLLARAAEEAQSGHAEPRKRAGRACLLLSRIAGDAETFSVFIHEAADWLRQAYRIDPQDDEVLLDLGTSSLRVGSLEEARGHFQTFIERNPGDLRGYVGHAECCFLLGDGVALGPDCDRILEHSPDPSPERTTAQFFRVLVLGEAP
jgi:tetratricopeptide (TPR) repeat protein